MLHFHVFEHGSLVLTFEFDSYFNSILTEMGQTATSAPARLKLRGHIETCAESIVGTHERVVEGFADRGLLVEHLCERRRHLAVVAVVVVVKGVALVVVVVSLHFYKGT